MRVLRWAGRFWTGVLLVLVIACAVLLGLRFLLPLLPFSPRPTLHATTPLSGAFGVAPRSQVTLQFSTPMNPRSVERALRFEPAVPLAFAWSADGATLAISPTEPLDSGQTYTLTLGANAQSRWFRELEAPILFRFATAPAPAVRSVFPQPGAADVALDTAISLHFSRPIVATDQVGVPQPSTTPPVRFEPAIKGSTVWLDSETALFQPATALQAGTLYTATVEAGLVDAGGGELAQPYAWSFSTPAPRLLSIVPADGAERVGLSDPLVFHFSQSFPLQRLQAALTISPTVTGAFSQALLPDTTQVVTFTPTTALQPDTTYSISLASGLVPDQGTIPLPAWTSGFTSTPQPVLTGRFPGEGQLLPSGQELRLIFNTPIDSTSLRNGLRFEPPIEPDTVVVSGNEARIGARFSAASAYTATIAADVSDLGGVALGRPYQLRFQTAPAAPALLLLDLQDHAVQIAPAETGPRFRRTNITQLDAAVYLLDEDSTVRLLSFSDRDWRDFSPERAGLAVLRQWSQPFTDTLNTTIDGRLPLVDPGQALPSGNYYLRLRTPDGLRQDVLVFVGDTRLVAQRNPSDLVVWATVAGAPVQGAVLVAYRGGSLVERGETGPDGTWRLSTPTADPLLVLAQGGFASVEAAQAPPQLRAALVSDRAAYVPGDTIRVGGFVRAADAPALPTDLRGTLTLRSRASSQRVANVPIELAANGVISASLELPAELPTGNYLLSLGLGSQLFTRDIPVVAPLPPPKLALDLPATGVNGTPLKISIAGTTVQGLPLASVPVSWTARYEPLDTFGDGYAIGETPVVPAPLAGAGILGRDGTFAVVISNTLDITTPLRLSVEARAATASGAVATVSGGASILPAAQTIGVLLPSRIVQASQPITVDLLVRGLDATPKTNQALAVELYSATGGVPTEPAARRRARVVARNARTGDDGRVLVAIVPHSAGEYQLVASAVDTDNRSTRTVVPLWVTADGFTGWPTPQPELPLVADQPTYKPGDTARLLIPAAIEPGAALVTVRRGQRLDTTVQTVQAGSVITVAVGAESPLLPVNIQFANQSERSAATVLQVIATNSLGVAVAGDTAYTPGATATYTVTTTDASGRGVPADVVFGLHDQPTLSPVKFEPDGEAHEAATGQGAGIGNNQTQSGTTVAWLPGLRTDAAGVLTVTLQMPDGAQSMFAHVWAAGEEPQLASAQAAVATTQPLRLALDLPPHPRVGDIIEVQAHVRNQASAPIEPRIVLAPQGLEVISGDLARSPALAVGEETTLVWQARVGSVSTIRVRLRAQASINQQIDLERPVVSTNVSGSPGALVNGSWGLRFDRNGDGPLEIAIVPTRAALVQSTLESIGALPTDNPADNAGVLLNTTPETSTVALVRQALASLANSQQTDGGWSWWPGEASDPELTLFVLEALVAPTARPNAETMAQQALQFLAGKTGSAADVRYAYAQSLFGQADAAQLAGLARAPQDLDSTSIAFLLLARSPDAARDRVLIDVLLQRAVRDQRGVYFRGIGYGGDLATTALVAQALAVARPSTPVLDELRRFVASAYTVDGWPNTLVAARATAALSPVLSTTNTLPAVLLNRRTLPTASTTPSSTLRLLVPQAQLEATNVLSGTINSGSVLVALGAETTNQPIGALLLRREYLDPDTRQPVDLATLRIGQLVEVRLTMVANQRFEHVAVEEALPGGMLLAPNDKGQMRFGSAQLEPGVYQYRYTLQAAAVGTFQAPAPIARLSDGTLAGVGKPALLTIFR